MVVGHSLAKGLASGLALSMLVTAAVIGVTVSRLGEAEQDAALSAAETGARDVAIVPGSRVWRGEPGHLVAARLEAALELYRGGRVGRILVSGNEDAGETSVMRSWLASHGVPQADLLSDPDGYRTIETMRNAGTKFGVRTAFICTQPISMARSIYLARANGIDAVPSPASADPRHSPRWIARELAKSVLAMTETIGHTRPIADGRVLVARVP